MNYGSIITIEPDKRGGKPYIRGLRITVYDVLEYLASGMTEKQIRRLIEDFGFSAHRRNTTYEILESVD